MIRTAIAGLLLVVAAAATAVSIPIENLRIFDAGYTMPGQEFTAGAEYWTPFEILRQAASASAGVIRMAGRLNRKGNFGEIRKNRVADILVIDGDPVDDISIPRDPQSSLAVIIKAGKVRKNTLWNQRSRQEAIECH